jgi:hypothetical protein
MPNTATRLWMALLAAAAALPAQAGSVEVTYADPARFTDVGSTPADREAHLAALTRHLKALGERRLPAGDVLRIELLDVDLAGTVRQTPRGERRIVRGRADWPRIELRYTLARDGRELRSGTERVSDLDYSARLPPSGVAPDDGLRYEKRALDEWFAARFGSTAD